jgi:predicted transcriptional regulator
MQESRRCLKFFYRVMERIAEENLDQARSRNLARAALDLGWTDFADALIAAGLRFSKAGKERLK